MLRCQSCIVAKFRKVISIRLWCKFIQYSAYFSVHLNGCVNITVDRIVPLKKKNCVKKVNSKATFCTILHCKEMHGMQRTVRLCTAKVRRRQQQLNRLKVHKQSHECVWGQEERESWTPERVMLCLLSCVEPSAADILSATRRVWLLEPCKLILNNASSLHYTVLYHLHVFRIKQF